MGHGQKVSCVLCQRSEETKITGALSTKDEVTAHQNCLLFSSGIYCRDSPQLDDLFGFSVEDVLDEVKRGSKLSCNGCKRKGATAGCEVGRCKKSYHYPCAVNEGAEIVEDPVKGNYGLYCFKHSQKRQENNGPVNGHASSSPRPGTSTDASEAGPSRAYCLTCEKTEGSISLDSLSSSIIILFCDKHAPKSQRNTNGDSAAAGRSVYCSDSSSSSSTILSHSKRRLSLDGRSGKCSSKRKCQSLNGIVTDDSSDSDPNETETNIAMFAPLESDIDGSATSVPESRLMSHRTGTQSPTGSTSGNCVEDESKDENKDDDDTDVDSESLLPPVRRTVDSQPTPTTSVALSTDSVFSQHSLYLIEPVEVVEVDDEVSSSEQSPVHSPDERGTAWPSVLQRSPVEPPPSPHQSKPRGATRQFNTSPEPVSSPAALPSDPQPSIDSRNFWKSCNAAKCTQAIFADFLNEMNEISKRIQLDEASQEDYDLALTVMKASGKLTELVTKQQKELQRKQMELQRAAAAMEEVISALRR